VNLNLQMIQHWYFSVAGPMVWNYFSVAFQWPWSCYWIHICFLSTCVYRRYQLCAL